MEEVGEANGELDASFASLFMKVALCSGSVKASIVDQEMCISILVLQVAGY